MRYDRAVSDYRTGIDHDTLRTYVPSAFADEPSADRSARYGLVRTILAVEALRELGYVVTQAMQQNVRGATQEVKTMRQGHTRHLLRFTQEAYLNTGSPLIPEIVLKNDSMGGGSYVIMIGVFRTVCQNGLITMTRGQEVRVRHTIHSVQDIYNHTASLADQSLLAVERLHQMEQIELHQDERLALAAQVYALRYDDDRRPDFLQPRHLLETRRRADRVVESTLAGTYNVLQENVESGQRTSGSDWQAHHTRGIGSIEGRVTFNQQLYTFAETIRRIHTGESLDGLVQAEG